MSTLEGKYWRFLKPEIQSSIMNIQDELENLVLELHKIPPKNVAEPLEAIMQKILGEIKILRDNGVDVIF